MQPFLLTSLRHLDHTVLKHILRRAGLSEQTVSWFDNLTDRTQCVQVEGNTSRYLKITKGVPQGSVLGPLPFILYINNIDSNVSKGKCHIQQLAKRLKLKLGFYFRIKSCLSFESRKRLVAATFMTILDYGDVLYMHASSQSLRSFDTVYHGSLMVLKSSLTVVMCMNMLDDLLYQCGDFNTGISFIYIYKGILGLLLTYISINNIGTYNVRSQDYFLLSVPKVRTELGKKGV